MRSHKSSFEKKINFLVFFFCLSPIPDKIVLANFVCLFFVNKVSRRLWNVSAGL